MASSASCTCTRSPRGNVRSKSWNNKRPRRATVANGPRNGHEYAQMGLGEHFFYTVSDRNVADARLGKSR